MELFVGLSIPRHISEELKKIQDNLRFFDKFGRYELVENYHLTLRYIGKVTEIRQIITQLHQIQYECFTLRLHKLGMFVNPDGNILWVDVAENIDQLHELQRLTASSLEHFVSLVQPIPFVPHISLAYGCDPAVRDKFHSLVVAPLSFEVTSFHLYAVERCSTGYRYRIIRTFQLLKDGVL